MACRTKTTSEIENAPLRWAAAVQLARTHAATSFTGNPATTTMPDRTAYHEAGHALMAVYLGADVKSITIDPDNDDGPDRFGDTCVIWQGGALTSAQVQERSIRIALAGPVAEMIYRGEPYHPGLVAEWASDWQQAWQLAAAIEANEVKRLRWLERVTVDLHRLLSRDDLWAALAAIVDNLVAHDRLDGDEVQEIVAAWLA